MRGLLRALLVGLLGVIATGSFIGAAVLLQQNISERTASDELTFAGFFIAFGLFALSWLFNSEDLAEVRNQIARRIQASSSDLQSQLTDAKSQIDRSMAQSIDQHFRSLTYRLENTERLHRRIGGLVEEIRQHQERHGSD